MLPPIPHEKGSGQVYLLTNIFSEIFWKNQGRFT
jgi:hypothetical protein